jgi:hypothetical protein
VGFRGEEGPVKKSLQQVVAEYGTVAVAVYFSIFVLVLAGAWLGVRLGWEPRTMTANVGTFTAAYLATKLTQPARIAATLVLTPFVARLHGRVFRRRVAPGPDAGG